MTKGYTTNAGVFAKRGDPWVTRKEGEKVFGRNLETENPDLDALLFAHFAQPKENYVDPPRPEKPVEASYSQRKANILMKTRLQAKSGFKPDQNSENPFNRFASKGIVDD